MARFLKKVQNLEGKDMLGIPERQARSMTLEDGSDQGDGKLFFRSQGGRTVQPIEDLHIGSLFNRPESEVPKSRLGKEGACPRCGAGHYRQHSDIEKMKGKFAKLLLGEDMSGGGKGVSSALALSNAITNLAASVFGKQHKLEPMAPETKIKWKREIVWLLSVADHIVEFVPSQQIGKDGTNIEIMTTQQRKDLLLNIPALRKLDAMLLGYLDSFKDCNEFWYAEEDADDSKKGNGERTDDKWWLPTVKVPPNGLSEMSRKWLQFQKESVNQVLKAAMAINAQVLMEMETPEAYIDSLPKNGRESLGDLIYRGITVDHFDPDFFLSTLDLSTEHKVLDLKNRIESSVVIWKRKMHNKEGKSWGSAVSLEKREQFEERAETILHFLNHRFPGILQSSILFPFSFLYVKDVGQSVLESYSRSLETLAYGVMSRIEDVLYADQLAQDPSKRSMNRNLLLSNSDFVPPKKLDPKEEIAKLDSMDRPNSFTLSDIMGWGLDLNSGAGKESDSPEENIISEESKLKKPPLIVTHKKFSYIEKLENLGGWRSPAARH